MKGRVRVYISAVQSRTNTDLGQSQVSSFEGEISSIFIFLDDIPLSLEDYWTIRLEALSFLMQVNEG